MTENEKQKLMNTKQKIRDRYRGVDGDFMGLREWEDLPDFMKTEEVKPYYEALKKKRLSLFFKRAVDLLGGLVLLVLLAIPSTL